MISLLLAVLGIDSDAELVIKLRLGNQSAFKTVFDRYQAPLHRYLLRRGVPESAAEDILQNAFLALWERRETIDPSGSLAGYLYRICHNRAANHFRDHAKFVSNDDLLEPSLEASQETDFSYAELRHVVDQAVSELPDRRRAVFELCFINGLTYREAADALDLSTKTVENQMGHALRTIRKRVLHLL